ncbi:MAG: S41 family peptidase [bacterium]|nr:S41 family peptidase [bacterium]
MKTRLTSLVLAIFLTVGAAYATKPSPQDSLYEQIRDNIGLFGDVYREIALRYVDSVNPQEFMRAGIRGMLSTLDPYTVFIEADETEDLDLITTGLYGGVGIEIGIRGEDKILTVISPMDDSPAQRVGIRSGDRILRIDTVSTTGFTTSDAAKYLRGAPGTQVTVVVERTGLSEPLEFVITRRQIELKDVPYYGFIEPGLGYIKLSHFSRRAPVELDEALREMANDGMQRLILDLRGNPGGLLSSAVAVTQRFCAKGETVLSVRGRSDESTQEFTLSDEPLAGDVALAVLVDGGSASASEIVAGAVQDLDRGVVIGEPTFGKGLVQSVVSFETGEALKLTTAKYFTPSGRLIQRVDYFHDQDHVVIGSLDETQQHFATRNGRPVEGGGGITPDIEVPTPQPGPLGVEMWRQGSFFDFVNDYIARHPTITSADVSNAMLSEFRAWLDSTHSHYDVEGFSELDTLRRVIEDAGLADSLAETLAEIQDVLDVRREQDFADEADFIRTSLERELAGNLFGTRGRIESSFHGDPVIVRALSVLADSSNYKKVLTVAAAAKAD